MAVPKRKKSKSKVRSRKRSQKATIPTIKPCSQCGEAHESHRVCPSCGFYRDRQVLTIEAE